MAPGDTTTLGALGPVGRIGYGTMSLTGAGVWGSPRDPEAARRLLRRARELGVTFFDTADAYGPEVAETLLREALRPYDGVVIATKGGLTRQGPGRWERNGAPEHLRAACEGSLRRLGAERIDLYQLHAVDPAVPLEESLGMLLELRGEGKIAEVGICNVDVPQLERARAAAPVVSVQNRYSLADRAHDDVLSACERHGLAFIPWAPLAKGALARAGGRIARIASEHGATPGQVALAWLLHRSGRVLPIPATTSEAHLEENVGAGALELTPEELEAVGGQLHLGHAAHRLARKARVRAGALRNAIRERAR